MMSYQKTVDLREPTTGKEIIDAMHAIADENRLTYKEFQVSKEPRKLKVGFSSFSPYAHAVILTGQNLDKKELQPEAIYEKIAVGRSLWGGVPIFAVNYTQKDVESAINTIANKLEAKLS